MLYTYRLARRKLQERQEKKSRAPQPTRDEQPLTTASLETQPQPPTNDANDPDTPTPSSTTREDKPPETPEEKAEKRRRRIYRAKIVLGLFAPFTLSALDTTIVASALPFIAADFGQIPPSPPLAIPSISPQLTRLPPTDQIAQLNWIITAFNLTSATFLPFWAQTADIWGRHTTIQLSIVIMTIGSAICTGAPTSAFGVLLLGRALQGVGAAGVNICVRTILADRVDLAEYAKNWTIFALISAVGFAVGPVAGGYLTQVSWRWCFGINIPVALVAIVLVVLLLRKELLGPQPLPEIEGSEDGRRKMRNKETKRGRFLLRLATIDFGGQVLFLVGIGLLVLAMTWAGSTYAWDSAEVVAPLVVGGVVTAGWVWYEWAMVPGRVMSRVWPLQRAMMPWKLMTTRDIGLVFYIDFCIGVAMFAVMYFMDLYFALVLGNSASDAGVALLYFLPGLGAGAYSAMFMSNVFPKQTQPSLVLATTTASVGISVLGWATMQENIPVIYGMMALTGYGVGLSFNPGSLHALAYFPELTAPIQCLVSFSNPFGGTVGLTIMSTVLNNKSGPDGSDPKTGIMWAFISIIPIMWMGVLFTLFLGNVWIRPIKEGGHDVVDGVWLWSCLRGKPLPKRKVIRGEYHGLEKANEAAVGPSGVLGAPIEVDGDGRPRSPRHNDASQVV
ncbi:hypothetical protein OQA88_8437 [Cercophora sp. LCS_1]